MVQYLLDEREYNELKRNETILNKVKQYILDSSEDEVYTDYAYNKRGTKVIAFDGVRTTTNINPIKLFKMLDIKIDRNIVINFINDWWIKYKTWR